MRMRHFTLLILLMFFGSLNHALYAENEKPSMFSATTVMDDQTPKIRHSFNNDTKILTLESAKPLTTLSIYNILGQQTYKVNLEGVYTNVDLSSLQSGIYIAKISNNSNATKTVKLVIKK